MCVYVHLCVAAYQSPGAWEPICGREGWRLIRGVWASSSGHLITAPAPTACLCLPQPPCLGASSLAESDDTLPSSLKLWSQEGSTLAQSTAVSD